MSAERARCNFYNATIGRKMRIIVFMPGPYRRKKKKLSTLSVEKLKAVECPPKMLCLIK